MPHQVNKYIGLKKKKTTKPKVNRLIDIYIFYLRSKARNYSFYYIKSSVIKESRLHTEYWYKRAELYINYEEKEKYYLNLLEITEDKYANLNELLELTPYDSDIKNKIKATSTLLREYRKVLFELNDTVLFKKKVMDLDTFKQIIYLYNKEACNQIIKGRKLNLYNGLGYLEARIIERNFKQKKTDFNATRLRKLKLLAQGVKESDLYHSTKNPTGTVKYTVFFVDDDWYRVGWKKGACKNISVYEFKPSVSNSNKNAFRNKFSQAIKNNPTLALTYPKYSYLGCI